MEKTDYITPIKNQLNEKMHELCVLFMAIERQEKRHATTILGISTGTQKP